jgi:hypothetical protein
MTVQTLPDQLREVMADDLTDARETYLAHIAIVGPLTQDQLVALARAARELGRTEQDVQSDMLTWQKSLRLAEEAEAAKQAMPGHEAEVRKNQGRIERLRNDLNEALQRERDLAAQGQSLGAAVVSLRQLRAQNPILFGGPAAAREAIERDHADRVRQLAEARR